MCSGRASQSHPRAYVDLAKPWRSAVRSGHVSKLKPLNSNRTASHCLLETAVKTDQSATHDGFDHGASRAQQGLRAGVTARLRETAQRSRRSFFEGAPLSVQPYTFDLLSVPAQHTKLD